MEDLQGPSLTLLFRTDRKMDTTNTRCMTRAQAAMCSITTAPITVVCVRNSVPHFCVFTFSTFPTRVCNRRRKAFTTDSAKYLAWFPLECPPLTPKHTRAHTHLPLCLLLSYLPISPLWEERWEGGGGDYLAWQTKKAMDAVMSSAAIIGYFTGAPCLVYFIISNFFDNVSYRYTAIKRCLCHVSTYGNVL